MMSDAAGDLLHASGIRVKKLNRKVRQGIARYARVLNPHSH